MPPQSDRNMFGEWVSGGGCDACCFDWRNVMALSTFIFASGTALAFLVEVACVKGLLCSTCVGWLV